MLKIVSGAIGALALTAGAATAADLPSRGPAPIFVAAAAPFSWTGFYVGANAGGAWGNRNCGRYRLTGVGIAPPRSFNTCNGGGSGNNDGRFTYGAQVGYNVQYNSLVLGVEADINGLTRNSSGNGNGSAVFVGPPVGAAGNYVFNSRNGSGNNYFGTVRARVGYAFDRLLVYVTGGLAYGGGNGGNFSARFFPGVAPFGPASARFSTGGSSSNRVGWTLGGGVEYAITNNWSVKGEYLYVRTGRGNRGGAITCTDIVAGTCAAFPAAAAVNRIGRNNTALNIVRIGVNYKF